MPTLNFNISEADIDKLNYERYTYPDLAVQKRIFAVYLKATLGWKNATIGNVVGLHYNAVGNWIKVYKSGGFEALLKRSECLPQPNRAMLDTKSPSFIDFANHSWSKS